MNKQFLEFWGNFLINAAKGKEHIEDMFRWITQGFEGFEKLTAMFKKSYGLEGISEKEPEYAKRWEKAQKDFLESFEEYLEFYGVVPKQKYVELQEEYEKLKERVAFQEETIEYLQALLTEKWFGFTGVTKDFQKLVERQGSQFQKMMEDLGNMFIKGRSSGGEEDN